jgi:acyl dehydratase
MNAAHYLGTTHDGASFKGAERGGHERTSPHRARRRSPTGGVAAVFVAARAAVGLCERPMPRWCYEDLVPGLTFEATGTAVTAEDIVDFARRFDPQPFHLDDAAAKATHFGALCASGWHTASMAMRLAVDTLMSDSSCVGSPGVDELRWLKPVYVGDVLTLTTTVLEAKPSRSRPGQGSVRTRWELRNQRGEVVMTCLSWAMFLKRAP